LSRKQVYDVLVRADYEATTAPAMNVSFRSLRTVAADPYA